MTQRGLSVSLGHTGACSPLRPCVSVAVESDAFDAEALTPVLEFRSSVAFSNCREVRKQLTT